jgi:hypothetical protein
LCTFIRFSLASLKSQQPQSPRSEPDGQPIESSHLGFLYYSGSGVPQSFVEAAKWYRLAADHGVAEAQHDLGVMYMTGQGVPQDYVLAHMWLNLAASQIPASKKEDRDEAVKARDLVASKMTPEQIAEAQKRARDWMQRSER